MHACARPMHACEWYGAGLLHEQRFSLAGHRDCLPCSRVHWPSPRYADMVKVEGSSKVLVYCMSGVSRSPAIVIAYLMKANRWRLLESYK